MIENTEVLKGESVKRGVDGVGLHTEQISGRQDWKSSAHEVCLLWISEGIYVRI